MGGCVGPMGCSKDNLVVEKVLCGSLSRLN